jgi:hypothetical protein
MCPAQLGAPELRWNHRDTSSHSRGGWNSTPLAGSGSLVEIGRTCSMLLARVQGSRSVSVSAQQSTVQHSGHPLTARALTDTDACRWENPPPASRKCWGANVHLVTGYAARLFKTTISHLHHHRQIIARVSSPAHSTAPAASVLKKREPLTDSQLLPSFFPLRVEPSF